MKSLEQRQAEWDVEYGPNSLGNHKSMPARPSEEDMVEMETVKASVDSTEFVNNMIKQLDPDTNQISDGYHTFGELYEHRIQLFITLCNVLADSEYIWKSQANSEGEVWEGWFLLGISDVPGNQITYHLPMSKWDECSFANVIEKGIWDGHNSADVLERLKQL